MNRRLIVKVDLVAHRSLRRRDVRVERLDIFARRPLTRRAHGDRFDHHARLGQMLGLNRAEVKHVAQPGDYRVAGALAHERAAGRAFLQAQQPGVLERSQRLAQRVARHAELLGQRALRRQPIARAQTPI